ASRPFAHPRPCGPISRRRAVGHDGTSPSSSPPPSARTPPHPATNCAPSRRAPHTLQACTERRGSGCPHPLLVRSPRSIQHPLGSAARRGPVRDREDRPPPFRSRLSDTRL